MPPTAATNSDDILEVCMRYEIFDDKNNLQKRSHNVWKEIARELKTITFDTVNSYVRNNRWNLLADLKEFYGIATVERTFQESSQDISLNSADNDEYRPYDVSKFMSQKYPQLFFNISFTEDEWRKIAPVSKTYGSKKYHVLQSGWTDAIVKACYLKVKIPCVFKFKNAKVNTSAEAQCYLNIKGVCTECFALFRAYCLFEPAPGDGITLRIHTHDTCGVPHNRKRHVTGEARVELAKKLLDRKPRQVRNEAVADISFGDVEPPYLPHKATYRKIKEEGLNTHLGVDRNIDPIDSLKKLKYDGKYAGYIKDVGADRFFVFYWSPLQMSLYKDLIKKYHKVEIDATGSLVKSILKLNGTRIATFLYEVVIKGDDGIQPLFQMLSEKHDTNTICYWLREIMRDGAPTPPEAVCDYSLALLHGICMAFNERNLTTYVEDCFRWLSYESLQHPLNTYIRVDIAHLIKIICDKKVFDNKLSKVKDFYVRSIGLMSTVETISDFKNLLKSVLIVAVSQYSGLNANGKKGVCEIEYSRIIDRIKTFLSVENDDYLDREYDHLDESVNNSATINSFINDIYESAQESVANAEETESCNAFYCPQIVPHVMRLSKHFPIWTNVMAPCFPLSSNVASSARCEGYFKDLKHSDLGTDYTPIRLDKFVVKHIRSIESISKLERAAGKRMAEIRAVKQCKVKRSKLADKKINGSRSAEEHLWHEENWRGLNKNQTSHPDDESVNSLVFMSDKENQLDDESIYVTPSPNKVESLVPLDKESVSEKNETIDLSDRSPLKEIQKLGKRGKYLRPCPNIEVFYDRPVRKRKDDILLNASLCKPIQVESVKYYIKNSCAFDSITEMFAHAYCNFSKFKNLVDEACGSIFLAFLETYLKKGAIASTYRERAVILILNYPEKNNIVDCYASVAALFEKLLPAELNCQQCGLKYASETLITVDGTVDGCTFSDHFEQFVRKLCLYKSRKCVSCKSTLQQKRNCNSFLCFELDLVMQINKSVFPNGLAPIDLPEKIEFDDKMYMLSGIITSTENHFMALCRNIHGGWIEYDDLSKKPKHGVKSFKMVNPVIIFYVEI